MRLERGGGKAGPDDETVGRGVTGGNAEAEWVAAPTGLGADDRRRTDQGRGSGSEKTTSSEHGICLAALCGRDESRLDTRPLRTIAGREMLHW